MTKLIRQLLILGFTGFLSACGTQRETPVAQYFLRAFDRVSSPTATDAPSSVVVADAGSYTLTRQMFAGVPGPIILVLAETSQQTATLRSIQTKGPYVTWETADDITLVTRDGLITATRGLGPDLMSADVSETVSALAQRRAGNQTRTHFILDAQMRELQQVFNCHVTSAGAAQIDILGESFSTRHLLETCEGSSEKFTNEYWFDRKGELVRSRQWIGPAVGYLSISKVL